jgi:hypothetical protein
LEEVERTKVTINEDTTVTTTSDQALNNDIIQDNEDTTLINSQAIISTVKLHKVTKQTQAILRRYTRFKKPPDLQRH